jgi:hypothetical protein
MRMRKNEEVVSVMRWKSRTRKKALLCGVKGVDDDYSVLVFTLRSEE